MRLTFMSVVLTAAALSACATSPRTPVLAVAAAAPALARAAREFEAAIGGVVGDYEHRPRPPRYRD